MNVSVFITSYNQKKLLQRAIESVINQTRMPDEVVIADDCSTDGSQKLIREYVSSYSGLIRPIFQEKNVGIPRNKNSAYRATSGDFVTYLDGDDIFRPKKIETDLETLKANPKANIACANVAYIDSQGHQIGTWCEDKSNVPTGGVATEVLARDFPEESLFRNEMVQRDLLAHVDFMDPSYEMYHDWELRIRLCQSAHLAYTNEITACYREHSQGISHSPPGRHFDEVARIYRKHRSRIEELPHVSRKYVNRRLRPWIGQFAWRAFWNAIGRRDQLSAWTYLLDAMKFAPRFTDLLGIAQLFLPPSVVRAIRSLRR